MIEKMKMVYVVSSASKKKQMLKALRDLGVLHIAQKKSAERATTERFEDLSRTASVLGDYAPKKKKKGEKPLPVLSDDDFNKMYQNVTEAIDKKANIVQENAAIISEIERIMPWGDVNPKEIKELKELGFDLHFYRLSKEAYAEIKEDENFTFVKISPVDKQITVATLGPIPATVVGAMEFLVPEYSIEDFRAKIAANDEANANCDEILKDAALYTASFNDQMVKAQNAEEFSQASETAEADEDFVWISGYVPEVCMDQFRETAKAECWAWAEDEVAEDDDAIPTKVRYNKVSKLIEPLFRILGILPGYRETDISLWFFLFFVLFFAMILGDAGYGCLILAATIILAVKRKRMGTAIYLLFVLSIATIVWGAVTGTWFGLKEAMDVPFLKAMVIPQFANYPECFDLTSLDQQNNIMKFSFTIGAIQMAIGSLISIKKKLSQKNLSWVADLGWMVQVIAMYLLSLFLVIKEPIPIKPVFILVGIGFVLVIVFGGMSPEKTFAQGIKSGVADAFTVFLNTISCFGNVMSYIRLFAVGMAGLAISQSFNNIAAGFAGPLIFMGIFVVFIGHALNLIMCFLSVIVHGVRLNVLEFSGQAGLEWTGIPYEPFKNNTKIKK